MRKVCLFILFLICTSIFTNDQSTCSRAQNIDDFGPKRLVIIKGKATIINLPQVGEVPATSETILFQKVGCESCFVGSNVDIDGNYKILVSDGKYKIIVRNPSSPEVDLLIPGQQRLIDTGSDNSPNAVFKFDIKIKLPE